VGSLEAQLKAAGYAESKRKKLRRYGNHRQPDLPNRSAVTSASFRTIVPTNPSPGNEEILTRWLNETLSPRRSIQSMPVHPVSGTMVRTILGMTVVKIGDDFWQANVSLNGSVCRGVAPTRDEAIARCRSLLSGARPKLPPEFEVHQGEQT
jgi:hypothetical protein